MQRTSFLAPLILLAAACAERQVVVRSDSSAEAASYAASYPERLTAGTTMLKEDAEQVRSLNRELAGRDKDLPQEAEPVLLLEIIEAADSAGRSQAFVDANHEARSVRGFWEEERGPIIGRANNAVQKQATEKNIQDLDVGPQLSYAVKDGIDKQLEKRLRENNEALRLIEINKAALGAGNVARVQKLADDIAMASYLVNVAIVEDRDAIERLNSERRSVESSIDRALEDEQHYRERTAKTPADRRASEERTQRLQKAKGQLAPEADKAEASVRDIDPAIQQARDEYDAALNALKDTIRARRDSKR
jgi:hypothetical protein